MKLSNYMFCQEKCVHFWNYRIPQENKSVPRGQAKFLAVATYAENDVRQMRDCESCRIWNRIYLKVDKAIRTIFENIDKVKDLKYLLKFAAKKRGFGLAAIIS